MFSTRPSTGTITFSNIRTPRRASISAMSCGVETITAPARLTRCAIVSCASPVPGGMSTTMMSSAPHATWPIICSSALITIGPRQIIGVSSVDQQADRHRLEPPGLERRIISPSHDSGLPAMPSIRGRLGP